MSYRKKLYTIDCFPTADAPPSPSYVPCKTYHKYDIIKLRKQRAANVRVHSQPA